MDDLHAVRMVGPLGLYARGFAGELARLGFTRLSAQKQLGLAAHLSRWLGDAGLGVADLATPAVDAFLAARRAAGYREYLTAKALAPLLGYLRGLGVTMLMRSARLSSLTRCAVRSGCGSWALVMSPGSCSPSRGIWRPRRCSGWASALRSLLRFWHLQGLIGGGLDQAVPKVANRRPGLVQPLQPDQVRALLASCERHTAGGRRDLAILTLLARMGLRAGEVAGLGLDDINWRRGEITIRGKRNRLDALPLPADVGEVIASYLREGRPATATDRSVFTRIRAPHRGLTRGGVTQVVAAAACRAGLGVIYAHRLRHSAATAILAEGGSLAEIGQLLRHRRPLTTAAYTKVDIEALRTLARPWPGVS
jgi:integrase/recombinase XerD